MTRLKISVVGMLAMAGLAVPGCTPFEPPRSDACCDPAAEPGTDENPTCVEGATCCADGTWRCNQGNGGSSCSADCLAGSCTPARQDACAAGEFCRLAPGECQDADAVGECTFMPEACILLFDPVCGCDGTTYGNECAAWSAGINIASAGPCE